MPPSALPALACLSLAGDGPGRSRLALPSPLFCEWAWQCLRLGLFAGCCLKLAPSDSYLLSKTMGCLSGCLMSSASIQKLFCGICSVFKCSFDEFVGENVVSPSYSSAILGPPLMSFFNSPSLIWASLYASLQRVCILQLFLFLNANF